MKQQIEALPCQELVELITDYLEGRLSPADQLRFEHHLGVCEGCRDYLEQMRITIRVSGRLPEESISGVAREALRQAFRGWTAGRGGGQVG